MKRLLFALLGVVLLAGSCSKETSQEEFIDDYFVRFRVGSETKEYKGMVLALRGLEGNLNTLTIEGETEVNSNVNRIIIALAQEAPLVAQTYNETPNMDSPALLYWDAASREFSSLYLTSSGGLTVNISDINEETVRGTFSGKVADLEGNELQITDGAFFAKVQ